MVSVDVKLFFLKTFRTSVKVEVAVLGSPSTIVLMVSECNATLEEDV